MSHFFCTLELECAAWCDNFDNRELRETFPLCDIISSYFCKPFLRASANILAKQVHLKLQFAARSIAMNSRTTSRNNEKEASQYFARPLVRNFISSFVEKRAA